MATDATVGYLDGQKSPFVVAPALTIIAQTFVDRPPTMDNPSGVGLYFAHVLPLLRGLHYCSYQAPMAQIVEAVVRAVPALTGTQTLNAILLRFPVTRSAKAIEFLRLTLVVVTKITQRELKAYIRPVFLLFARCVGAGHVKLATVACSIWNRIELEPFIMDNAKTVFGTVHQVLVNAQRESWSPDIAMRIEEVFRTLNRIDCQAYRDLCRGRAAPVAGEPVQDCLKVWAGIARAAAHIDSQFCLSDKLSEIQKQLGGIQRLKSFKSSATLPQPPGKSPPKPGAKGG
jgi:hypothetical protein